MSDGVNVEELIAAVKEETAGGLPADRPGARIATRLKTAIRIAREMQHCQQHGPDVNWWGNTLLREIGARDD